MSTVQQTKPRRANQSITDESGRPGTVRSNVGCDAIDEPWTKSTAGLFSGVPTNFSHRKRRTSPLRVQCSTPVTAASAAIAAFISTPKNCLVGLRARVAHDARPLAALALEERREFAGRRAHDLDAGGIH